MALTFPRDKQNLLQQILQLIDAFGVVGSRSRNGYGSIALYRSGLTRIKLNALQSQPLPELINGTKEYPSALGTSAGQLLCWETSPQEDWRQIMEILAGAYMKTRTSINIAPQGLQQRHILGYPVTHHNKISEWGGPTGRMPSQLRLMVKRNQEDKLVGRILHLPHKLPKRWESTRLKSELDVWQDVHKLLDKQNGLHRYGRKQ